MKLRLIKLVGEGPKVQIYCVDVCEPSLVDFIDVPLFPVLDVDVVDDC